MVVSVVGKDPARVQKIFLTGTVVYNGYRYSWQPLPAELPEITTLLAPFPDDDPSRLFDPLVVTRALLEIGGGTQRSVTELLREDTSAKKWFASRSPWDVVLELARDPLPRYEKYSYALRADLFRLSLAFPQAQLFLAGLLEVAPRGLRLRWSNLRPPAAVTYVLPR